MKFCTVIVDSSYCPIKHIGTYALWVTGCDGTVKKSGLLKGWIENSFHSEFKSAINAIWFCVKILGYNRICVQTDCDGVVQHIKQRSKLFLEYMTEAGLCHSDYAIYPKHVKGHTADTTHKDTRFYVNRWCDKTAYNLLQKSRRT